MAKKKKTKERAAARPSSRKTTGAKPLSLKQPHLRWLDSVAESVRVNGGPSFSREDVLEAIIDAASSRRIDLRTVRTKEALRVAFGAFDTTELEAKLRESRGGVEASVLDALKDSIK